MNQNARGMIKFKAVTSKDITTNVFSLGAYLDICKNNYHIMARIFYFCFSVPYDKIKYAVIRAPMITLGKLFGQK
jgi:hypothetical protein